MLINEVFLGLNYIVKRLTALILVLFFALQLKSQEAEVPVVSPLKSYSKITLPRVSIRASCTVPKIISSKAYRTSYSGIYDGQVSVNFRVAGNINVGLGYKSALFTPQLYFRQKGLNTKLQVHDGFLKFGYDHMFSRGFVAFSIDGGYSYNKYTNVIFIHDSLNGKNPTDFASFFLRPEIAVNFLVEENFAFGFIFAYNYCLYKYDTSYNGFGSYADSKSTSNNIIYEGTSYGNKANIGWFSFGFGFYYGFKKKTAG